MCGSHRICRFTRRFSMFNKLWVIYTTVGITILSMPRWELCIGLFNTVCLLWVEETWVKTSSVNGRYNLDKMFPFSTSSWSSRQPHPPVYFCTKISFYVHLLGKIFSWFLSFYRIIFLLSRCPRRSPEALIVLVQDQF